ncbi:MAG: 30S ribosomal protein S8 [Defluviitaleaceae bacterium]|nr:30S ribosomal protein S8 [Defluviitaleaceae bacterium]
MMMTDPIADMLTRIRNANSAKHKTVDIPLSRVKNQIAEILVNEGYVSSYEIIEDGVKKNMRITLKYGDKARVLSGLRRISKPGLRVYAKSDNLPKVLNGLGVAIVSTNMGIVSDKVARKHNVGGEVLAFIW